MKERQLRNDAPKCDPGNIPCGGICIPREKKCGGKQKIKGVLKRVGRKVERVAIKAGDRLKEHLEDELEIHNRTKKTNDEVDRAIAVRKLGGMAATALATGRPSESDAYDKAGEYVKESNARKIREEYKKEKQSKLTKKDSIDQSYQAIAQIITDSFDASVQAVTSLGVNDRGFIFGTCMSGGNFYRFDTDAAFIEVKYLPKATQEINAYTQGLIDSMGFRVDSENAYDWLMGFIRMDGQVKCKSGGTPCGKRCLPKGQKCKISGGGAGLKSPKSGLKMPGAGVAGLAAAGLAAAGAGVVGYRGRKEIGEGIKNAKGEVKKGIEEAKENMNDVELTKKRGEQAKTLSGAMQEATDILKGERDRVSKSHDEMVAKNPMLKGLAEKSKAMMNSQVEQTEAKNRELQGRLSKVIEQGEKAGDKKESRNMAISGVKRGASEFGKGLKKGVKKGISR